MFEGNLKLPRRQVLAGCGAFLATGLSAGDARGWQVWKDAFLRTDGRVVDDLQDAASHSEGQGYGMVLAQAEGDRAAFALMETWAAQVLAVRDDGLMSWRWRSGQAAPDPQTATDGDLFRAWALWRAVHQSGWTEFAGRAEAIVAGLVSHCLAVDPRTEDEPLLTPAADSPRGAQGVLFNPSYIMSRALRELGQAHGAPQLIRAADHGETMLAELSAAGLVPDWTLVTPDGFRPSPRHSALHGYDAARVALYLIWSGRGDHPAVARSAVLYDQAGPVPVVATSDGIVREVSDYAGFRALRALVRCIPLPGAMPGQPYYPATLGRLAGIARREGGCT